MSPIFNREDGIACGTLEIQHQTKNHTFQYGLVEEGPWKPLPHGEDRKFQIIMLHRCTYYFTLAKFS